MLLWLARFVSDDIAAHFAAWHRRRPVSLSVLSLCSLYSALLSPSPSPCSASFCRLLYCAAAVADAQLRKAGTASIPSSLSLSPPSSLPRSRLPRLQLRRAHGLTVGRPPLRHARQPPLLIRYAGGRRKTEREGERTVKEKQSATQILLRPSFFPSSFFFLRSLHCVPSLPPPPSLCRPPLRSRRPGCRPPPLCLKSAAQRGASSRAALKTAASSVCFSRPFLSLSPFSLSPPPSLSLSLSTAHTPPLSPPFSVSPALPQRASAAALLVFSTLPLAALSLSLSLSLPPLPSSRSTPRAHRTPTPALSLLAPAEGHGGGQR